MGSGVRVPYAPPETDNFRVVRFFCFVLKAKICVLIASTLCGYSVRLCVQARSLSPYPHLAKAIDTNFLYNLALCRCVAALSSIGVEPILAWFIARHFVSALFSIMYRLYGFAIRVPYAPPETDNFRVVRFFCFVFKSKICVLIASTLCGYDVRLCVQARSLSPYPHLAKAIDTNFLHNLALCRCVAALSSRGVEPI